MKKFISLILAAVLLLSLSACAPSDSTDSGSKDTTASGNDYAGQLLVGYGKEDITPTESVPLSGYGNTESRMSTGFWSKLYHIAVAVTDSQGNTAILISSDIAHIKTKDAQTIRKRVAAECGISEDNVIISAIHQHSTPDMGNEKAPSGITYKDTIFIPGAVNAAKAAMENRAPATVQTNAVETENMNFVRHYIMEDGSYAGANFGNWKLKPVKHTYEVDNTIQLVKFVREGQTTMDGKQAKNIILANFQGHPIMGVTGGDAFYAIHSDLIGIYRDEVESKLDCQAIYFSGPSGDVHFTSEIKEENKSSDYKAHGKKIAKAVIKAEDSYTDIEITSVKAGKVNYTGNCNHAEDDRLAEAQRVLALYQQTGNINVFTENGFESQYHPGAIVNHFNLPPTKSFDLFAISFGDLAFVAAPYEMFSQSGEDIKTASPFKMTIIATQANGGEGYFPTQTAWDYGCYEQYNSNYERGTAEKLVDEYVNMLKDLHG